MAPAVWAARADPPPRGGALVAMGYRGALWDPAPSVQLLDEATGDVPVVAISGDYHSAWLNSAALHLLGLAPRAGTVREAEWFAALERIDALPGQGVDTGLARAEQDAARRGVVGIVDFDFAPNHELWPGRVARGLTDLRVHAGFYPDHLDAVLARGIATGAALDDSGLITLGPLKIISDGSLNTRTAYCFDPYPGGGHGALNVSEADLTDLARRASAGGIELAVHAIGDRANAVVLDVFARTGARGSIEHAQLLADGDAERMADLSVLASVQPAHLLDDREPAAALWPGKTPYTFASMQRAGVRLALGSDAPVAPLDPWLAMSAAVGRGDPAWLPRERLTPASALAASTGDHVRVTPGMPADLALLTGDPLPLGADADRHLREMTVAATILGGRVTHDGQSGDGTMAT